MSIASPAESKSTQTKWPANDPISPVVYLLGLFVVTGVGVALRYPLFDRAQLHVDEYLSLHRSLFVFDGDYFIRGTPSQKPPLFYFVLAFFYHVFGYSVQTALMPGTIASLALIPATAWMYLAAFRDRTGALLAALLVAVSPFHVLFSPTILLDPQMILLGVLATAAACSRAYFFSGLLLGLALCTKQQGILFAPMAVVAGLLREYSCGAFQKPLRGLLFNALKFCSSYGLCGIALYLWGRYSNNMHFVHGQLQSETDAVGGSAIINPLVEGFRIFVDRAVDWSSFLRLFFGDVTIPVLLALGAGLLLGIGVALGKKRASVMQNTPLLYAALFAGFASSIFMFHVLLRFRYVDRYLLLMVPFMAVAMIAILRAVILAHASRVLHGAFLALVVIATTASSLATYQNLEERAWVKEVRRRVGVYYRAFYPTMTPVMQRLRAELSPDKHVYVHDFIFPAVRSELWGHEIVRTIHWPMRFLTELPGNPKRRIVRYLVWPVPYMRDIDKFKFELGASGYVLVPAWDPDEDLAVFKIVAAELQDHR